MIRGMAEAVVFTGLAVALHLGGLALAGFGQGGPEAGGAGGQAVVSLQGGSPATEALLSLWTDPPEVGSRADDILWAPAAHSPRPTVTSRPDTTRPDPADQATPAALPRPEAADPPMNRPPTRAPDAPRVALRIGALPIPAPETDGMARPVPDKATLAERAPRAALHLETPQDRPGDLPQVGSPSAAPGAEHGPPKARLEPDPKQTRSPQSDPPALRAAGTGGGAAAGMSGASQQAAAVAGRDRLLALWGGRIRADVERRKHYPRAAAGAAGTAVLRIAILGDGRLQAASLDQSAGHPALDRAALAAVRGTRFSPAPEGLGRGPHDFTFQMTFAQ